MRARRYKTLVADPPWKFKDKLPGKARGAEKHYKCMTPQQIGEYGLPPLAPDCRLFLWRVSSMQEEACQVIRAWDFVLKAELVWCKVTSLGKPHFGMGRQVRGAHETCLIATRGKPERLSNSIRSTFTAPVRIHSEKPDEFYQLVERLSPGPYVELFARKRRSGWTQYGDQLEAAE